MTVEAVEQRLKKVALVPRSADISSCRLMTASHPRTGQPVLFGVPNAPVSHVQIYQFQQTPSTREPLNEKKPQAIRSWMLTSKHETDNCIIQDGSLLVVTQYDPLFLLLGVLQDKAGHHFVSLDTLLEQHIQSRENQDDQDMTSFLLELFMKQSTDSKDLLLRICDRQEVTVNEKEFYYKFNPDKTLAWLKRKVDGILQNMETLDSLALCRHQASYLPTAEEKLQHYQRIAVGLISDNLNSVWEEKLYDAFNLPVTKPKLETATTQGDCTFEDQYLPCNAKSDSNEKTKTVNKKAKSTPASAAVKSLSKASTQGMKKLSSFFTRK